VKRASKQRIPKETARLELGRGSYEKGHSVLNYGSRKANGDLPTIRTGSFTSIADGCKFVAAHHLLDRGTTSPKLAPMLFEHGQGHHSTYARGDIEIGNDVWIGANATIMDGVTIHDGAVVAACSLVNRDVEPYAIVAGTPAKFVKWRVADETLRKRLQATAWWGLPDDDIQRLNPWDKDISAFVTRCEEFNGLRQRTRAPD
jgi:acetyltransferase-like isoleucine patch superfamily enzyme